MITLSVIFLAAERCELLTGINIVKAVTFLDKFIFPREESFENFSLMLLKKRKFRRIKIIYNGLDGGFAVFPLGEAERIVLIKP